MPVSATGVRAVARAFARLIEEGSIPKPDMAIYVGPTMLDIYVAHMGFIVCDCALVGKCAYFGIRLGSPDGRLRGSVVVPSVESILPA